MSFGWSRVAVILACSVATLAGSAWSAPSQSAPAENSGNQQNSRTPKVLSGSISELAAACDTSGIKLSAQKFPAYIESVRPGSPAAYSGLKARDDVLAVKIDETHLQLTIRRNGKTYQARIALMAKAMQPLQNRAAKLDGKEDTLSGSVKQKLLKPATSMSDEEAAKILSDHDLVVFIDCSNSMNTPLEDQSSTRWQWCQEQVSHMATELYPTLKGKLTIVTFSDVYRIRKDCSTSEIQDIFRSASPGGHTNLGDPLKIVLDDFLRGPRQRPCVIAIVHDGVPNQGADVDEVIATATKSLASQSQLLITFLQVGEDTTGSARLDNWDKRLVNRGAKYDVVKVDTFKELQRLGLLRAIAKAVNE